MMMIIFDCKLSFIPHIRHLNRSAQRLWTYYVSLAILHGEQTNKPYYICTYLYRSLIRSKLDYGCVVYGSTRSSYLCMLDPVQNHALRLCLGAYRTSPSSSLCVLANEPPLYLRWKKLSMQYCLKLSATSQNPACSAVFAGKF